MSSDTSSVSDHDVRLPTALAHKQLAQNIQQRPPTPETEITEQQQHHPDIAILCEQCQSFVAVRLLQAHRAYHNALVKFEYYDNLRPDSVKALTKRRQHVLSKLTKSCMSVSVVQEVNDAFELLKAYLEDTYEDLMQVRQSAAVECHGLALNCSAACAHAVGICSDANQRWKPNMEDTRVFQDYFGNDSNKGFFAIYDGYSGRFAADVSANDLHHFLLNEMAKFDDLTKCTCTINLAGYHDLTDYKLDRPRPIVRKESIRHILHEESRNIIQQIIHTCEENIAQLDKTNNSTKSDEQSIELNNITPGRGIPVDEVNSYDKNVEAALRQSYRMTDYVLSYGIDEVSRVRWSGCSAVTCIIHNLGPDEEEEKMVKREDVDGDDDRSSVTSVTSDGDRQRGMLYLANAGNCHAVLCRNGKAERLTRNHTLSNNYEKSRVKKAGASVQGDKKGYRVNGVLDTTRGLGNHGDPRLKAAVAAEPFTTSVEINSETDFLILATNGIWEVLKDSEAVSLLEQMLPGRDIPPMTAPGEDDYLRMIKGHSKDQIADLHVVADDLGELGIHTNPDEDNEQENDDKNDPEKQLPEQVSSPKPNIKDQSSRPSSSNKAADNKGVQQIGLGQDIMGTVSSNGDMPEPIGKGVEDNCGSTHQLVGASEGINAETKENEVKETNKPASVESIKETNIVERSAGITDNTDGNEDKHSDAGSEKTDFESMISAILENDDGNEADVETLTELQSIYASSRLSGCPTRPEMYRSLAQAMCERLVQSALLAGARDNITAMVILLPGCKL